VIHWHLFRRGDVLRRTSNGQGRDGEIFDYVRDADTFPIVKSRKDGQEFVASFDPFDWELLERGPNW